MYSLDLETVRRICPTLSQLTGKIDGVYGTDRDVANAARTTIGMEEGTEDVKKSYMRKLYMCEHSPIRIKQFNVVLENVPSWVATHFVRHNIGFTPFVSTQREDRVEDNTPRDLQPQGALVKIRFVLNAQAAINVSKVRLCHQASKETRMIWRFVLHLIKQEDKELVQSCVPTCVYRGFCPEHKPCGYSTTSEFLGNLITYRNFRG